MTKIREIVEIKGGYTSYVDLYEEFKDPVKNHGRMSRYKPITAHRVAFERIAKVLNPLDRRFYFLRGSYGTGKSHLLSCSGFCPNFRSGFRLDNCRCESNLSNIFCLAFSGSDTFTGAGRKD